MNNKNLIIPATLIAIGAGLFLITTYGKGGFFQGNIGNKPENEQNEDIATGDAPYWCAKFDQGEEGSTDTTPPTVTPGNPRGGGGSSGTPGSKGTGIGRYNPKNNQIDIYSPGSKKVISKIPINKLSIKDTTIAMLRGNNGKGGNDKAGDGGKPKPDTSKVVIKDYHECSCNATYFTIVNKEVSVNGGFPCPAPDGTQAYEAYDSKGIKHEITVYSPPKESCQKEPKSDEVVEIDHICACDEASFSDPITGTTYDCPKDGLTKKFGNNHPYSVEIYYKAPHECDTKWECPEGYDINWPKIYSDCDQAKFNECQKKDNNDLPININEMCQAFDPSHASLQCVSIEACKQAFKLYFSDQTNVEAEATYTKCYKLYGNDKSWQ